VLDLEFSTGDLARTRFACSPLWECVAALRALRQPAAHALHRPWLAVAAPRVAELRSSERIALLDALVPPPPRALPSFLAPTPAVPSPDLDDELAALRAVPAEEVRAELDRTRGVRTASLRELYAHPSSGLDRLAGEIRAFWEAALAEDWPRVRALLEADVLYRAREQTDGGPARLFNALDPAIRWRGDTLSIRLVHHSAAQRLDGRGVVLVPSAFAWPRVLVKTGPVWPVTVRYPPRGVGLLWTTDRPAAPDALAGVLGATRAMLLTALASPASTTELARRLRLSPGAVSQQLTALRAAGLVTARRSGRYVLYTRTAVADAFLTAAGA
jgi:DNA-binding transcriptional ArsR family regulator